jgi:hypothetical protein
MQQTLERDIVEKPRARQHRQPLGYGVGEHKSQFVYRQALLREPGDLRLRR